MSGRNVNPVEEPVTWTPDDLETTDGFECGGCGHYYDDNEAGPALYECGSCGTTFNRDNSADGDSARCPDCNKFSAKQSDRSCPECEEGPEEPAEYYTCPNDGCDFRCMDRTDMLDHANAE